MDSLSPTTNDKVSSTFHRPYNMIVLFHPSSILN
jgi:hypothetical protein